MPWGAIRAPEQVAEDRHFHERGFFTPVEHTELGVTITYPGAAARYSRSLWRITRRAPLIGEHSAEVGAELGITSKELADLRAAGAFG